MPSRNKPYSGVRVNILNFQKKIPINRTLSCDIKKAARETFFSEKKIKSGQINICLCDDNQIQDFNRKYLSKDGPTDVIAFNLTEASSESSFLEHRKVSPQICFANLSGGPRKSPSAIFLADIIVSTDTVILNAGIFKTAPIYELLFCVVHGFLHVLGYEDNTKRKMQLMYKKQERICRQLRGGHKVGHQDTMSPSHR